MQTEKSTRNLGLWLVEGCPVYILGSLHMLGDFAYPLPVEMERAYSESTVLVIEADSEPPAMPTTHLYNDGRTLETVLPPGLYHMTNQVLAKCSSDIRNFHNSKPWHLALIITSCFYRTHRCVPERGIDAYFTHKAKADKKMIVELESMELQFQLLDNLPLESQFKFLTHVVENPERTLLDAQKMIQGWLAWDTNQLTSVMEDTERRFPGLTVLLLTDRNKKWIPKIEQLMQKGEPTLIVVGALHLIGQDSVIELLQSRGHRLTQLSTAC